MTYSYDPATSAGQVRMLAVDADQDNHRFEDAEIQAFLALNNGDVRLSAAQALDTLAAEAARVQGRTKFDGVWLDGQVVAEAMAKLAVELRRQVHQGDVDGTGLFDWAEQVVDTFTLRQRLLDELLRKTS